MELGCTRLAASGLEPLIYLGYWPGNGPLATDTAISRETSLGNALKYPSSMDTASRLEAARGAVALALADWEQQGAPPPVVSVGLGIDGGVDIGVNGGGTFPSASGEDRAALVVSVANYLQAELMEWGTPNRVWPTCPQHSFGLHARLVDRVPAWSCSTGGHVVASIGSLARPCP